MQDFEEEIELLVSEGGQTYLEALSCYEEQHGIDDTAIVHLLKNSKPIMAKLKAECQQLSLLSSGETRNRTLNSVY